MIRNIRHVRLAAKRSRAVRYGYQINRSACSFTVTFTLTSIQLENVYFSGLRRACVATFRADPFTLV